MSHLRAVTARARAFMFSVLVRLHDARERLTRVLLALPLILLPKAVLADGDLADMVRAVGDGAKTSQSASLTIAQFIGVVLFIGGVIGFKKVGRQGGGSLIACIVSLVCGALLVIVPEILSRTQKQMGTSAVTVN
ncbi:DUF6750 family protein [Klebsiella sp. PL-2018]|uniref:DUF6750 family protein n=1 Tax=Klebsiella TaxID=570 RepID=UPI001C22D772|nr:DUF6750 family protein [Klebsiella sp. PL-2018]QXD00994.1 IncI1 plasmid conjugative transfer protein TraR [Klebsiella sp. PL-2018]